MGNWNFEFGESNRVIKSGFFYNGKNVCLRGGQEQRALKLSQIRRETTIVNGKELTSYVYTEFGSKNRQGGLGSLYRQNKVVRQHENTTGKGVCHVAILDKYLQKIPAEAINKDVFYLTPLQKVPIDQAKPWFKVVPVGKNRLNAMLKEMSTEAGLTLNHTNHSLRAYGTTTMFQANVPDKLIKERTGHRSLKALHQYERNCDTQLLDVSNILSNNEGSSTSCDQLFSPREKTPNAPAGVMKPQVPTNDQSFSENGSGTELVAYGSSTTAVRHRSSLISQDQFVTKQHLPPPAPTFIFNSCNFSSCPISFSGSYQDSTDDIDELLKDISVDQLFDP